MRQYDYVVIGAGIIGLTIALELKSRYPDASIAVAEKESDVAYHASGRNSGVLHAGFYYTANSLKAKFAREGNRAMQQYCRSRGLAVNPCGKLVVAGDEEELRGLEELKRRGDANGVELHWMSEEDIRKVDPNARTFRKALFSPTTVTVDPLQVCMSMKRDALGLGIDLHFDAKYEGRWEEGIMTGKGPIRAAYVVNAAGLYADRIARDYGFGERYTIIPFKGMYVKYVKNKTDIRTNIYPVPNLANPFLGVHYTKTVDGSIKIGPTAIPAFWREQYRGFSRFKLGEFLHILYYEAKLFVTDSFRFRRLAFQEMKKYFKPHFVRLSMKLAGNVDPDGFGPFMRPGIRAQLLDKKTLELVQDFIVEGDDRSMHVLNAVSPAFTCSIPFAAYVVDTIAARRSAQGSEMEGV
ncbi:L-2-hydroxyglutarate oxidase [Paenibacillus hemerocallicola]|uniref:L-2-hydroxyglutarate oxidase n=1 Tax=Paenibacillus hemerocallicola TaxID=1172614 RepID=A0A5C4SXB3_9BACL|nr:L-2-hydroxyglutarate oxidase [Paenibacillus hemerocallicola]TNJ60639.1 L-2-hydroxyglutarate oxidase [Paenibacillus hemerocallicola]